MTNSPHLFKWAGSKRSLIPKLTTLIPPNFGRYVEPFCGSCSLFFHLKPASALLSDSNPHLINALSEIKKDYAPVYELLSSMSWSSENYYNIRSNGLNDLESIDRAAAFIFLVRNAFNGLYRTNKRGAFNVPYAATRSGFLPDKTVFRLASHILGSADIACGDFEENLRNNVKSGDFVYLDPPYATRNRRIFRQYGPDSFGVDDIRRLDECLTMIDKRNAYFILSYADAPEVEELRRKWGCVELNVNRTISGFKSMRRSQVEIVLSNAW